MPRLGNCDTRMHTCLREAWVASEASGISASTSTLVSLSTYVRHCTIAPLGDIVRHASNVKPDSNWLLSVPACTLYVMHTRKAFVEAETCTARQYLTSYYKWPAAEGLLVCMCITCSLQIPYV